MSADLTHLRATLTEHGSLDKSTILALIDRAEKAERQSAHATSALKALAERNIGLTEQKRVLNVRFDAMRAGRDSERSRADKNANKLEQAEQKVASLKSKMDGENLRWVAWEMVENSGQLDLPVVTWINRISDDEVSIEAAKYFFFGGISPCIHLNSDEPFDIDDEDRPECEHCNRRALDGDQA
ncbi:hypothetical protein [Glutamicibacter nicotianae]|uniref:hypothetical protein n=1 Tax=Glutamicibacter nicotianae TaxID=37929 RepID=UPI00195C000A|nr:hypothetical protein [Glutamicibacter nicotianae]MBM7767339.1 putative RNA-binding protein [Glutamicibacter nicotianae]